MTDEVSKNLWSILRFASASEWETGAPVRRLLRELAEAHGLDAVALEILGNRDDGALAGAAREWHRVFHVGQPDDGHAREEQPLSAITRLVTWRSDRARTTSEPSGNQKGSGPHRRDGDEPMAAISRDLGVALGLGAQLADSAQRLKAQSFQDNYRVVTLEALYDVGLAIASTLNLEDLTAGILLRAVSLLDARRGALYLLEDGDYRLDGTIGGEAVARVPADDQRAKVGIATFSESGSPILLSGAAYSLTVAIAIDGTPRGLLVLADKESRKGIGPFNADDERALALFANQAAIALENAHLHRQALEKERMEREMELAAEIQRAILPSSTPTLACCELIGWNRPTRQVGGDYYGWLRLPSGETGIVVADVTGKGMPAALLVNTLHSALELLLDTIAPGVPLIERLNDHVRGSSRSNKFITLIMVTLDPDGRGLSYINAGHNPGLLIRSDGSVLELRASGLPLGLMPGSSYRSETLTLDPGDLVCLYSDGITECADRNDDEYGLDRLSEFLRERRTEPLATIMNELDTVITAFADGQTQQDDQTVVLLRREQALDDSTSSGRN